MARTKKMVVTGVTREQAEQAFAEFAAADAKVQNLTSKMDGEMTRIREKYAEQLAALNAAKDKGFTWAAVTNLCKELLPSYIRISEELAKDKLLADRELPKVAEYFPKIGVQVVQEETFYVEPKKEGDAVEQ